MFKENDNSNEQEPEQTPSRSQQKRDHHALQKLAESLIALTSNELDQIDLSGELRELVVEGYGLKRAARQRQMRYLAKRLVHEDTTAVSGALERLRHGSREETVRLRRVELWRDRLLAEGQEALSEFLGEHPRTDRQQLRQLIKKASSERERDLPPKAFRRLFTLLREQVEAPEQE